MQLILGAGPMARDLGLVATGAHVAPAAPAGGGAIDEEVPASLVGADPQPGRVVIGQELRERAGDGGARLVEPVAYLGEGVARSIRISLDLVVVQSMAKDVVELAKLFAGGVVVLGDLRCDAVQNLPQMLEPLEPPSRLLRVAPQSGRLRRQATATDQSSLAQPGKQRGDIGNGVSRLATLVLERVSEGDEQLLGLVGLGESSTIECHVTIIQPLTSYPRTGTVRV